MIVIPMAGLSSRFFRAGYDKPKYMLEAHGKTIFEHSVKSFETYFDELPFLFIVRPDYGTPEFVKEKAAMLGIKEFHIVTLSEDTRGQAETVALGLERCKSNTKGCSGPVTIFNIDTFRPEFKFPNVAESSDGYLEVFIGSGKNWSFAKPAEENSTAVSLTAEKKPISNLCSTGLYHFNSKRDYLEAYYEYLNKPVDEWEKGELYIAPLYNVLIAKNYKIHYHRIDKKDVIFCGVPDEYEHFVRNPQ